MHDFSDVISIAIVYNIQVHTHLSASALMLAVELMCSQIRLNVKVTVDYLDIIALLYFFGLQIIRCPQTQGRSNSVNLQ